MLTIVVTVSTVIAVTVTISIRFGKSRKRP